MSECDGKRAGDPCVPTSGDAGLGTCVPDCDAQCFTCVPANPMKPDEPVVAGGGCGGGLAILLVFVAIVLR